jgi:hypothetical protein
MRILCLVMNMWLMKILIKLGNATRKLYQLMNDIIMLGGVLETYASNRRNMIKLYSISHKQIR